MSISWTWHPLVPCWWHFNPATGHRYLDNFHIVYPILSKVSYNLALLGKLIRIRFSTNNDLIDFDEFCNFGFPHVGPKNLSHLAKMPIVEHCDPTKTSNELGDPLAHYHWLSHPKNHDSKRLSWLGPRNNDSRQRCGSKTWGFSQNPWWTKILTAAGYL